MASAEVHASLLEPVVFPAKKYGGLGFLHCTNTPATFRLGDPSSVKKQSSKTSGLPSFGLVVLDNAFSHGKRHHEGSTDAGSSERAAMPPTAGKEYLTPQIRSCHRTWKAKGLLRLTDERIVFIQHLKPEHCVQVHVPSSSSLPPPVVQPLTTTSICIGACRPLSFLGRRRRLLCLGIAPTSASPMPSGFSSPPQGPSTSCFLSATFASPTRSARRNSFAP